MILVSPNTIIKDIPKSIKCSKYKISDMKEHPKKFINRGYFSKIIKYRYIILARKIGEEKFKVFLDKTNLLKKSRITIRGIRAPH